MMSPTATHPFNFSCVALLYIL